MKISIITATYNSFPYILDTIACVKGQKNVDIEYIVVDGVSKDQTVRAIQGCANISKYISEPDNGIYDALNKGIKLVTGDVIGFVHSDDLLASTSILSEISACFENENIDGVYGDLVYIEKENTSKVIRYWKSQNFKRKLLDRGWMPAHPTLFLRKEVYNKHGLFDLSFDISADYDFMLRILKDSKLNFVYLPKVITKMRVGGKSNRNLKNVIKKSKEDYRAIKNNRIGFAPYVLFMKNISKISQFLKK